MIVNPTAFYWIGRKNWGDLLTPILLSRFANIVVKWAPAPQADMIVVGSILESVDSKWTGFVAGSGKLRENHKVDLKSAKVLGLRGWLSAKGVKGSYVIGDPGLLADELVSVTKEYDLGIIMHWSDKRTFPEFAKWNPHIIDTTGDTLEIVSEIGRCKKIVTTSLHGMIVADAFSIPRRLEYSSTLDREGGVFKFKDYLSSLNMELELGVTQQAPRYRVEDIQHELYDELELLGKLVRDEM